jgi:hypothetical protein
MILVLDVTSPGNASNAFGRLLIGYQGQFDGQWEYWESGKQVNFGYYADSNGKRTLNLPTAHPGMPPGVWAVIPWGFQPVPTPGTVFSKVPIQNKAPLDIVYLGQTAMKEQGRVAKAVRGGRGLA